MILTLDAKRRLTLPAGLAPASPGDASEAWFDAQENEIVFRRTARAKSSWTSTGVQAAQLLPQLAAAG